MEKIEMSQIKTGEEFFEKVFSIGFFNDAYILPDQPIKIFRGFEAQELPLYLSESGVKYLINLIRYLAFSENAEKEEYKSIEDFAVRVPEFNFRVHLLKRGATSEYNALIMRRQFHYIPEPGELKIPETVEKAFMEAVKIGSGGIFLVVGKQRQGKSTTIVSLLNEVNKNFNDKVIITIENPIEYLLDSIKSVCIQKDIVSYIERGTATTEELIAKASKNALISASREFPSVLAIGEIRTKFEIEMAVSLAESGVFVVASFHAETVPHAIVRFINTAIAGLSPDERKLRLQQILRLLKVVVAQKLLPNKDEKVIMELVCEYFINDGKSTDARRFTNLLLEQRVFDFYNQFARANTPLTCSFSTSLKEAEKEGRISSEVARTHDPYRI